MRLWPVVRGAGLAQGGTCCLWAVGRRGCDEKNALVRPLRRCVCRAAVRRSRLPRPRCRSPATNVRGEGGGGGGALWCVPYSPARPGAAVRVCVRRATGAVREKEAARAAQAAISAAAAHRRWACDRMGFCRRRRAFGIRAEGGSCRQNCAEEVQRTSRASDVPRGVKNPARGFLAACQGLRCLN